MSYSSYDYDNLETADTMKIERRIYFESGKSDLSELVKLPLAELLSCGGKRRRRTEVFDRLKTQAAAWEEQPERPCFWTKPWNMPGHFPSPTLPTSGSSRIITAYPQQHGLSDVLFHFREHRYDRAAQASVSYSGH